MNNNRRRHFRPLFKSNASQLTFAFQILIVCGIFMVAFSAIFIMMLQSFNDFLLQYQIDATADLEYDVTLLWDALPTLLALLMAFFLSMFLLVIERTQRVFGPVQNMKEFLSEIEKGNLKARVRIRKNDDFQKIVQKLNLMAESLERRNSTL